MAFDSARFTRLCQTLATVDLFGDGPPAPPWRANPTVDKVRQAVDSGKLALPVAYQTAYVTPLESRLPSVLTMLAGDSTALETIIGAVYDHAPESAVRPQLQRFLAVISNLYRSFLSQAKRAAVDVPANFSVLPPLAMFQHDGREGPFTLPCDDIRQLFDSSVGVVSLPATYRDHPIIWAALAHETGGHDVTHADVGLLDELGEGVRNLFGGGAFGANRSPNPRQLQGQLWSYWIDEAAADVFGILNIGPQFVFNLAAFFAALNERAQPGASPLPSLRTDSGPDELMRLDPHPTDILRLHLGIGAIENLIGLADDVKAQYIEEITALSRLCAQGATSVTIQGDLALTSDHWLRIDQTFELAQMQEAARQVGAYLVTMRSQVLKNHSIQDIETWDNADEGTSQQIATAFMGAGNAATLGDDAQLLAGATMAVLARPDQYQDVSTQLAAALDVSFANDPIWSVPHPHLVYQRYRRLAAEAPDLRFALRNGHARTSVSAASMAELTPQPTP